MNYITKKCARETDRTGTGEGKIKEHSSNAYPFIDFNSPSNTVPQIHAWLYMYIGNCFDRYVECIDLRFLH